jgi:hypothetical protein
MLLDEGLSTELMGNAAKDILNVNLVEDFISTADRRRLQGLIAAHEQGKLSVG